MGTNYCWGSHPCAVSFICPQGSFPFPAPLRPPFRTPCVSPAGGSWVDQHVPEGRACQRRQPQADPSRALPRKRKQGRERLSPSCQAQALLNFPSLVSCSPRERGTADGNSLSKRTAYSRQSPEHFHKEAWLAQGGTHHHGHCAGLDEQAVPSSSVQAKPQNPTQSQQCLARGGTCKPLECMLPGRQATHTGLPGQAAALRAARAGDKGFRALEFLTSGQHRHSTGWRGWH